VELVNRQPHSWDILYHALDRPWQLEKRRLTLDRLNTQPLIKLLQRRVRAWRPAPTSSPAEILVYLRKQKLLDIPVGVVVTDFDAHAMCSTGGGGLVLRGLRRDQGPSRCPGIPPRRSTDGVPIDPVFAKAKPKRETREKMGWTPT